MRLSVRSSQRALVLVLLVGLAACATLPTPAKVVLTPVTVVRDIVDAPFASLANMFESFARSSSKTPTPSVGVGVGSGGVHPYAGVNLGYYVWKPLSWIFGGVDYVVGRMLWPNWPTGISPWKEPLDPVSSIYFPNTKALWREPGDDVSEEVGGAEGDVSRFAVDPHADARGRGDPN